MMYLRHGSVVFIRKKVKQWLLLRHRTKSSIKKSAWLPHLLSDEAPHAASESGEISRA